jgi:hypothetical protein
VAEMMAVPANFARSVFVVNGMTRTDCSVRVSVSLCQMTTGLRPVCSLGLCVPRSAHHSSPSSHGESSRSSSAAHASTPSEVSSSSSAVPAAASRARFHRAGSGRRTRMIATRSPCRSGRGSSGLRIPSSYRASTGRIS